MLNYLSAGGDSGRGTEKRKKILISISRNDFSQPKKSSNQASLGVDTE
jgi:hypothetical protein